MVLVYPDLLSFWSYDQLTFVCFERHFSKFQLEGVPIMNDHDRTGEHSVSKQKQSTNDQRHAIFQHLLLRFKEEN